ncbi:MAG: phosphoglucosamine mutase [Lentimicrobiaceae bacterium]|nr:phosphoglucosamine mutase [Lentimicrobiaceae bacterium]
MTLIKSISGIRGTIGGKAGDGLSPIDIVKFTAAFVTFIKNSGSECPKLVVGRDARTSGFMVNQHVCATIQAMGANVIDIGLSTTPTVEIAIPALHADGGIIITASHNPAQWNALKLVNNKGEFISAAEGAWLLDVAEKEAFEFVPVNKIGRYEVQDGWIDRHIEMVLKLPLVDKKAIAEADFKIAVDAVNSTGGIAIPALLKALGVRNIIELNCRPDGNFQHNPEPLAENLTEICRIVKHEQADLGLVVDPDVDRLAIIDENGMMFGEEYTLVSVADYVLSHTPGNTVSNLSSTRALRDITIAHGQNYAAAAVGEVNVVEKMKATNAVIGGEGNGGIIYPESHYGRDALVGVALFLTDLARKNVPVSALKKSYPLYFMSKNKIELDKNTDVDALLEKIAQQFHNEEVNTADGVKIDFAEGWVHLRKSNTEPIIRIYSEGKTDAEAKRLASFVMQLIE